MSSLDEQAYALLANTEMPEEDRASMHQLINAGEMNYITDGPQLVGFHFPIVDQDPGDEDD